MSKHTPGPWRVVEDRVPSALEVYAGKTAIAECWRRADAQTELANARLIASAPELLEVLQEIVRKDLLAGAIKHDAHAAIAKATGGEG